MSNAKKYAASGGFVATANVKTIFQREIFFQVDPADLDYLDSEEVKNRSPSGIYVTIDPLDYMKYLPELEAEIFWLIFCKEKNQGDIGKMLKLSQPTVSYRYRRVLKKLRYLMVLVSLEPKEILDEIPFLKDTEREILFDLLYYTNQEMVGKRHGIRQSSVKWIFVKTKRKITTMELEEPEKWFNHLGLMLLLERNLNTRILS